MSGRHGYRSQRRPGVKTTCETTSTRLQATAALVAAAPQPIDCPACNGAGRGCGTCGGLGFLGHDEWKLAVQLAFVHACDLILPCEADEAGDAA